MRRAVLGGGLVTAVVVLVTSATLATQRLYRDRQYERLIAAGDEALRAGDAYGAVEAFSGALALRPQSMVAHFRRGEAYRELKRFEEAVRDWKQASRLAPDAPQPLIALGDLRDAMGRHTEAADWYARAADRLRGEDPALLYRLAVSQFRSGVPAAAVAPLKTAIARNEGDAAPRYLLALVYRDMGQPASAVAMLESALELAPDLQPAREELAELYRELDRPADEVAQLQILAARDPQVARRIALAEAEARRGQLTSALGTLNAALAEAPNDSRILLAIGRLYLVRAERADRVDRDAVARALSVLERALGGTAPRSEGLALYGRALFLAGQHADAERILGEAVATSPVYPAAFLYLADVAERAGHDELVRDALLNLEALEGDTAPAARRHQRARRIGEAALRAGDVATAVRFLDRAVDAGLDDPLNLGRLAQALWLAGDRDRARSLLVRALAARPDDAALQRLTRLIR